MDIVSTDDVRGLKAGNIDFVLVNVLPSDQFERAHIPGSRNNPVDSDDFLSRMIDAAGGDLGKRIIVYCASEDCDASTRAARALESAGFSNVSDYEGGLRAWQANGGTAVGVAGS